ncbi:MAG: coproporphyrinogen III oxidase [Bacteroidetes bacterium]|nr:MAG: coproporphyrinogen III oxidase [Bacteroidota bacterium]
MAGIYVHIPFCKQACNYCNFHFSTSLQLKNDLVVALLKEIELTSPYEKSESTDTIYFGGGTPSLLGHVELSSILNAIFKKFKVVPGAEITLEANPDDINPEVLKFWKDEGINRLSIGIQSFYNRDLRWMNRAHNSEQGIRSMEQSLKAGFDNFSIDLIYGIPGLMDEEWVKNIEKVTAFNVPHISCYALTVEPKTALKKLIETKKVPDVDAEQQSRQFLLLMEKLEAEGYDHYEISNFAVPGKRSRHNSSYWMGKPYYGFGPAAHSYDGINTRSWNIANNALYIKSISAGQIPFEKEELNDSQKLNEYIMTSLRTMEGMSLLKITDEYGEDAAEKVLKTLKKFEDKIYRAGDNIILTKTGKLYADGIASELFVV